MPDVDIWEAKFACGQITFLPHIVFSLGSQRGLLQAEFSGNRHGWSFVRG